MDLSIIIPAHNEEKRIKTCINNYKKILSKNSEVIVVCNACTDNTFSIVKQLAGKDNRIKALDIQQAGKGNALIQGFKIARGEIIGFLDADNAFNTSDVKKLIQELMKGSFDAIIGSKWKNQKFFKVSQPFYRKVLGRYLHLLANLFFSLGFNDTQCGAKFFKKHAVNYINKHEFNCKGYAFDIELLFLLKSKGLKIREEFIKSKHVIGSKVNIKVIPGMFLDLINLRLKGIE